MKVAALLVALLVAACATSPEAAPVPAPAQLADMGVSLEPSDLNGTWDVTLFWSPTEPPSATVMVLNVDEAGVLSGSFYDSEFVQAQYSLRGETLAFGSVTTDGSAPYSHSGRLIDGKIEGQTLSQGRDFLMIWVATRRQGLVPG